MPDIFLEDKSLLNVIQGRLWKTSRQTCIYLLYKTVKLNLQKKKFEQISANENQNIDLWTMGLIAFKEVSLIEQKQNLMK